MLRARPSLRTRIVTLAAWPDRNTAAWPAELPPPTRMTSSPRAQPRFDRRGPVPHAAALKGSEVVDGRSAIARAGRDHQRSRANSLAVAEVQRQGAIDAAAVDGFHLGRDHDLGAEFLRLHERASGQRLAGNAGRKSEIVLDPRAGAGLAAIGAGIQDDHRQALGSRIDRGREPGGPAADDGDVVDLCAVQSRDHAERAGKLGDRRVAQHRAVRADHQRQLRVSRPVFDDQLTRLRIDLGIEHVMRLAVATEKGLQADDVVRCRRADQDRAAGAGLDQADAAQDQRPHDALAELRLGHQQPAQGLGLDHERLDIAFGVAVDQGRASGQRPDLGQELPGTLIDDRRDVAEAVALGDGHMAADDDEHAAADVAGLEQALAVAVAADRSEPSQPLDFLRRQLGNI